MSEFRQPKILPGESAMAAFLREQDQAIYESELARLNAPERQRERRAAELRQMPVVLGTGVPDAVTRARRDWEAANGGFAARIAAWFRRP